MYITCHKEPEDHPALALTGTRAAACADEAWTLKRMSRVSGKGPAFVWLTELGLASYAPAFEAAGYNDQEVLAALEVGDGYAQSSANMTCA